MAALAPSDPMKGPAMLRPPSYAMSAKRLTMPMTRTNPKAVFAMFLLFLVIRSSGRLLIGLQFIRSKPPIVNKVAIAEVKHRAFRHSPNSRSQITLEVVVGADSFEAS